MTYMYDTTSFVAHEGTNEGTYCLCASRVAYLRVALKSTILQSCDLSLSCDLVVITQGTINDPKAVEQVLQIYRNI